MPHTSSSNTTTVHSCVRLTKTLGRNNGHQESSNPPLPSHSRPPMVPGFGKPMLMTKPSLSRVSSTASSSESISGGGARSGTVSRQPSYDNDDSSFCDKHPSPRTISSAHQQQQQQQQQPRDYPSRHSEDAVDGSRDDAASSQPMNTPCLNTVIGSCINASSISSTSTSPSKNRSFLHGGGGGGGGGAASASTASIVARRGSSAGSSTARGAMNDEGASVASLISSFGIYHEAQKFYAFLIEFIFIFPPLSFQ